jgi:hypothetical protein
MLKKIVSGGQTGAYQAALDFAIVKGSNYSIDRSFVPSGLF